MSVTNIQEASRDGGDLIDDDVDDLQAIKADLPHVKWAKERGHISSRSLDTLLTVASLTDKKVACLCDSSPASPIQAQVVDNSPECIRLQLHVRKPTLTQVAGAIVTILTLLMLLRIGWAIYEDVSETKMNAHMEKYVFPKPATSDAVGRRIDPAQWLRENIQTDLTSTITKEQLETLQESRPKAAFISLVSMSELEIMVHSITQFEARFNSRVVHQYDWVFFSPEEFTDEFKLTIENATTAACHFEVIPDSHWSVPEWIDISRFNAGLESMRSPNLTQAAFEAFHHMRRWNAGLFAIEAGLEMYQWFWRIEPGVSFDCDVNYDIFRFMRDNQKAYGFNMAVIDDAAYFPALWRRTQSFMKDNIDMVQPDADMNWLLHGTSEPNTIVSSLTGWQQLPPESSTYKCRFFSNFVAGSLEYFRAKEHRAYFDHLDKTGGFYYQHFGDTPVQALSVSMFLPKSQVWFFRHIGCANGMCDHCPDGTKLPMDFEADSKCIRAAELSASLDRMREHWDNIAQDIERQHMPPVGYTVNFFEVHRQDVERYTPVTTGLIDVFLRVMGVRLETSPPKITPYGALVLDDSVYEADLSDTLPVWIHAMARISSLLVLLAPVWKVIKRLDEPENA